MHEQKTKEREREDYFNCLFIHVSVTRVRLLFYKCTANNCTFKRKSKNKLGTLPRFKVLILSLVFREGKSLV